MAAEPLQPMAFVEREEGAAVTAGCQNNGVGGVALKLAVMRLRTMIQGRGPSMMTRSSISRRLNERTVPFVIWRFSEP